MKALILNIGLSIFGLAFFTACGGEQKQKATEQTPTENNQEVAGVTYTCPMHPEVVSQEPGKCPKCGMNLEKATAQKHAGEDSHEGHAH